MDVLTTAIEIILSLLALWLLRTYPKTVSILFVLVAYFLRDQLNTHRRDGYEIIGKKTMKAAIFAPGIGEHGVTVDDISVPNHASHELLIQVNAAGLNPSNFKVNMARIPFFRHTKSGKHVIGYDVEGVVLSSGTAPECESFALGARVYGFASGGSIAEYALVACTRAARSPTTLTSVQTAGLPVVALTSQEAWDRTNLKKGDSALVIGASGGCGTFGVTLAKALGATVTGICSTKNVKLVYELGADAVVDYRKTLEMDKLKAGGKQFDVIYDTVTSFAPEDPDYEPDMRPLLKQGGRYVAINGSPLDWILGIWEKILFKKYFGMKIQREHYDLFLLTPTTEKLERVATLLDAGKISPTIMDMTYHLTEDDLNKAFTRMKSRRVVGKICFEMIHVAHV